MERDDGFSENLVMPSIKYENPERNPMFHLNQIQLRGNAYLDVYIGNICDYVISNKVYYYVYTP
jgi:hypothetical protein